MPRNNSHIHFQNLFPLEPMGQPLSSEQTGAFMPQCAGALLHWYRTPILQCPKIALLILTQLLLLWPLWGPKLISKLSFLFLMSPPNSWKAPPSCVEPLRVSLMFHVSLFCSFQQMGSYQLPTLFTLMMDDKPMLFSFLCEGPHKSRNFFGDFRNVFI